MFSGLDFVWFFFFETVERVQCDMRCDMNAMSDTERSGNNKLGKRSGRLFVLQSLNDGLDINGVAGTVSSDNINLEWNVKWDFMWHVQLVLPESKHAKLPDMLQKSWFASSSSCSSVLSVSPWRSLRCSSPSPMSCRIRLDGPTSENFSCQLYSTVNEKEHETVFFVRHMNFCFLLLKYTSSPFQLPILPFFLKKGAWEYFLARDLKHCVNNKTFLRIWLRWNVRSALSLFLLLLSTIPLFPANEVQTRNGAIEDPHTRFKIAMNSQRMWQEVFVLDRETSVEFSSFLVKFVFCVANFESIEWPKLAQQSPSFDRSPILLLYRRLGGRRWWYYRTLSREVWDCELCDCKLPT